MIFGHFSVFGLVRGHFGLLRLNNAHQAAKQPLAGKAKVSKVTAGYREILLN